jgi:uncharacterized protein YjiS (DUF1127 family)
MTTTIKSAIRSTSGRQRAALQFRTLFGLHQQRNSLSRLSTRMLLDIGVSRDEALHEGGRPVWNLSRRWMG